MRKLPDIVKTINLESQGEITGEIWRGIFQVKVILTHAERFAIERTYKTMLPNDSNVDDATKIKCASIAELEQRIVSAPEWFKAARNGRDLVDAQPLYDLMTLSYSKLEEWRKELAESANPEADKPQEK